MTLEERLLTLLKLVAYEQRPCRECGEMLYWISLPEGRSTLGAFHTKRHGWVVAYNGAGVNHAGACPGPVKKQPSPEQQTLLSLPSSLEALDPQ
jgi:hypothetical protein